MNKTKIENTIEILFETKYEMLDKIIVQKIKENKYKFKDIKENKIIDEIKENLTRKQIEQLLKDIEENNSIKNSIIMKAMYEQGFKDGVNLIIDCKKSN
mgnify:CR=1 FL=1